MLNQERAQMLFSKERLNGYVETKEHYDNFVLIRLIKTMCEDNALWLENVLHELISHQSLGFWLRVVERYKIHNRLFGRDFLERLDFKCYFSANKNRIGKKKLRAYQKVSLMFKLFRNLRNRAFENLISLASRAERD